MLSKHNMQTQFLNAIAVILVVEYFDVVNAAMTMKQIEQSMAMFRKSCSEKMGVSAKYIDGMHRGEFPEDVKELKCFTLCVAESAGTLTKKKEISEQKVKKQIETQLPAQLRPLALGALDACKDVQKNYKDPCDKIFFSTKCMYDFSPKDFLYP